MTSSLSKVSNRDQLRRSLAERRCAGEKIVFTNGCFDILHPGHLRCLQSARRLGDALVVAINSDEGVRRLKGPGRPVLAAEDRAEVLAGLECVTWVTIFEEETPLELIRALQPDVLVKGGDWRLDRIVGKEIVEASGGQVLSIPYETGHSTSGIIERIRRLNS